MRNHLRFYLSFISLKEVFGESWDDMVLSQSFKVALPLSLAFIVSDDELVVILIVVPLYTMWLFLCLLLFSQSKYL